MTKSTKRLIANRLRKYRKSRGLKQRDAARILGFADASSLSRWEQGVCMPSAMNMFRLAALYRTLVDALYIDTLRTVRNDVQKREVDKRPHENHARYANAGTNESLGRHLPYLPKRPGQAES